MSENPTRLAYGIPEAANLLSIERSTLYRHAKLGRIRIRKLGGRSVILSDDLAEYLRQLPVLGARVQRNAAA
jgi:excisionase family DNA binding protein